MTPIPVTEATATPEAGGIKATYVRIPQDHWDELKRLAIVNDRSVTAELRRAVRLYLEGNRPPQKTTLVSELLGGM